MQIGASRPWQEVIMVLTNNRTSNIEAEPLLEFFEPLMTYLKKENKNEYIGWKFTDPTLCPGVDDEGNPLKKN